ncbi:MAG: GAF domain-containing protein [Spirochaetia bacterium]|nr:GAF domain-containing protein [Spirochaetia bacterium]
MIYNVIIAAAVIDFILGTVTLARSRNRLSMSFFYMSMLLGIWNICVAMWQGYGHEEFARINFLFVALIPPAGYYLVMCLYDIKMKSLMGAGLKVVLSIAAVSMAFTAASFFDQGLYDIYESMAFKIYILVYEFLVLSIALGVFFYRMFRIQFKQERIKLYWVAAAFGIMFTGGMLDFTGGIGLHELKYPGNIANVIYAMILFYTIFKHRLFDMELVLKNFLVYSFTAVIVTVVYITVAYLFRDEFTVMAGILTGLTFAVVYYIKYLNGWIDMFVQRIGGVHVSAGARNSFNYVRAEQTSETEKIDRILLITKDYLEVDAAVYRREGTYAVLGWETQNSCFSRVVDMQTAPSHIMVRYETAIAEDAAMLDGFKAAILAPLRYGGETIGVLAGRRQTADISFNEEEIELLRDMAESLAFYVKAHLMARKELEEENLKRIGMMAHRMAHEIKNPLTALWGAAQLLDGNTEAERENVDIIKDEIRRLTGILDSWKDFAGDVRLEKTPVDPAALVAEVAYMIKLQGVKADITVEKFYDGDITVSADAAKLKQVLLNLALNAVQAARSKTEPRIEARIYRKQNGVEIRIKDNGPGINSEVMAKIKTPLFTTKPKGSGLGLAISDRIIKAHGGSLIIESDGSTYTEITAAIP